MLKRRYGKRTKELYESRIRRYFKWLDGRKPSQETAQEFLDDLESQGRAPNTIAANANAIRAYFKEKGQMVSFDTPGITIGEPRYITVEELYRILEACQTPLEKCLVTVLFDTGCRVSEILELKIAEIDWDQGFIHVVRKGGREADVNISPKALDALREFLAVRKSRSKRVFMDWEYSDVWKLFKNLGKRAGVPDFTAHRLRHARAVQMLEAGVELHDIQMVLGHVSITTTANIYSRLRPARLKARIPDW